MSKVVFEAPGVIRILQALRQTTRDKITWRPLKPYTAIKRDACLGDPSLAKHLRKLVTRGLIERDPITRAYRITQQGEDKLGQFELAEHMRTDVVEVLLGDAATRPSDLIIISFREPRDKRLKERVKALEKDLAREKLLLDSFRIEARHERSPAPELQTPKESPYELILLREGLIVRNEKTGKYEVTDAGMRFMTEWDKARPKTLPAWLRNKQEAKMVASRLSAILS